MDQPIEHKNVFERWMETNKKLIAFVKKELLEFWEDIIFGLLMMTQEWDDTSFLVTIEERAVYTKPTLIKANIFVHIFMNLVLIWITCLFTKMFIKQKESVIFGMLALYFICAYEFLFHIVRWFALYMGLYKFAF